MNYIYLFLLIPFLLFSQVGRDNFVGGYDATVNIYNDGGAPVSYWKAIKFSPFVSARIDTLKWGFYATSWVTVDTVCMAVWTSDETYNRPGTLMFYGYVEDWPDPGAPIKVDIEIPVTNIVTTDSLTVGVNYFISMMSSAPNSAAFTICRGRATTCVPNPRKIGNASHVLVPPPAGGSQWNIIYEDNCYGWGVYSIIGEEPPEPPVPGTLEVDIKKIGNTTY